MKKKTAPLVLEAFLPYRMVNLSQQISSTLAKIYEREFGISIAQWRVIANLGEKGALSPKDISEQTSMDKARVSRAVRELSEAKLVSKHDHQADGRAYILELTAAGRKVYAKIAPKALKWEQELVSCLTNSEHAELMRILGTLEVQLNQM